MTQQFTRRPSGKWRNEVNLCTKLFIAALCLMSSTVQAHASEFNVQHDGVPQFCAPGLQIVNGAYNFVGTCSAPPPPTGWYTQGSIIYPPDRIGTPSNTDLTRWENSWGRTGRLGTPTLFPGASGSTPQWNPTRGTYIAARFVTPSAQQADAIPAEFKIPTTLKSSASALQRAEFASLQQQIKTAKSAKSNAPASVPIMTGQYKVSSYYSINYVDVALSSAAGDFAPSQPKCHVENATASDQVVIAYQVGGTSTFRCVLQPGTAYHANIKPHTLNGYGRVSVIHQGG